MRLHDDMEAVEEKRARYEEELDRVNDMLTESESRRQALQNEVDRLLEQVATTHRRIQIGVGGSGFVDEVSLFLGVLDIWQCLHSRKFLTILSRNGVITCRLYGANLFFFMTKTVTKLMCQECMACDACDETRYLLFSITFRIFMFYKGNAGADKLCDITLI